MHGDAMPLRAWTPAARRINGRRLESNRKFVASPLEEPGFKPRVPGHSAADECGWGAARRRIEKHRLFRRRALAQQGSSDPVRAYIGLKSWASLAALPLGKS